VSRFAKAVKRRQKLRVALVGPTGSGKTYTALRVGAGMAKRLGGRMAVIDTERGSASLYGDLFDFDTLELTTHSPKDYRDALAAAAEEGYVVVVLDSLSHAWMGKDGALEQIDKKAARDPRGNSFTAWRDVTPEHNKLVDAMLAAPYHLIATMRSKTEWVMEEDSRGKKVPRKVGMAPVQRDGVEYEFTVVGDLDIDHRFIVSKTRANTLDGLVIEKPGEDLAKMLMDWLETDSVEEAPKAAPAPEPDAEPEVGGLEGASAEQLMLLRNLLKSHVIKDGERDAVLQEIEDGMDRHTATVRIDEAMKLIERRERREAQNGRRPDAADAMVAAVKEAALPAGETQENLL
jgi:energy-coupling factor transporter ATP-binding protein EcfA2